MKLEIIFENEDYLFVSKPSGLLTIPDRHNESIPSLVTLLKIIYENIWIVHRIDKETSGCICFAKNENAHKHASILFEKRGVIKKYLCLINGTPHSSTGIINEPIAEHPTIKGKMCINYKGGKESITEYSVVESFGKYSLVSCLIHTGRTHQIRIHMANMGHPVLCDSIYGGGEPILLSSFKRKYNFSKYQLDESPLLSRIALHSSSISFKGLNGDQIDAVAPLPRDLNAMLTQCRKWL